MNTYLWKSEQQCGPFTDEQIRIGLTDGTFNYEDMAWREGLAEWQTLSTFYPRPVPVPVSPVESSEHVVAQSKNPFASPVVKYGGGFVLLCLALVICGIIASFFQESPSSAPTTHEQPTSKQPSLAERLLNNPEERAKKSAKTLVLKNIKSPSTANFAETRILYKEHPWYQIHVLVDAQNSFGAYIRGSFVCTLKLGEGDKFSYMPTAGIQEMDESLINLAGVLDGIRDASGWPGTSKGQSN